MERWLNVNDARLCVAKTKGELQTALILLSRFAPTIMSFGVNYIRSSFEA